MNYNHSLEDLSNCLSEEVGKKYNYIKLKKRITFINEIINLVKIKFDELNDFNIVHNEEYKIKSKSNYDEKTNDYYIPTLNISYYLTDIDIAYPLLYKFIHSINKLNYTERFITINSIMHNYTDDDIMNETGLYKNKYNLVKKSAVVKLSEALDIADRTFDFKNML